VIRALAGCDAPGMATAGAVARTLIHALDVRLTGPRNATRSSGPMRVFAVLLLLLAASCAAPGPAAPRDVGLLLRTADPVHPEFERALAEGRGLFEAILQIDRLVYPDLDVAAARDVFDRLRRETDLELERAGTATPGLGEAAAAFLRTLDRRRFVYDVVPPRRPGQADSKVVCQSLLRGTGSCGTFSLLCLAYLRTRGLEARLVCVPDHCYLQDPAGSGAGVIECTDFESPLRPPRALPSGLSGHYGRPLDPAQALWHYYVDRLWSWVERRSTDPFALRAMARGRSILGSSCRSLDAQEAARRALAGTSLDLASGGVPR